MGEKTSVDLQTTNREQECGHLTLNVASELVKLSDIVASREFGDGDSQRFRTRKVVNGKEVDDVLGIKIWDVEDAIFSLFATKQTFADSNGEYMKCSNLMSKKYQGEIYDYNGEQVYHIGDLWFLRNGDTKEIELLGKGLHPKFFNDTNNGIIGTKRDGEILLKKMSDNRCKISRSCLALPGDDISQINDLNSEFLVVSGGKILRMFLEDVHTSFEDLETPIEYKEEGEYSFDEFGDIQGVDRDINQNFVLIVGKNGDKHTLYVLRGDRWTSGEVLKKIEGVKEFVVMKDGSLLSVMDDGKIKSIATTFTQFEKGYFKNGGNVKAGESSVNIVKNNSNEKMLKALESTKWDEIGDIKGAVGDLDVSEQDVIFSFRSKKIPGENKTIKELFEEADTQEDMRRVEGLVNRILLSISSFQGGLEIKNHIKDTIIKKKEEIILRDFQGDVNSAENALSKADNFQDLINVKSLIKDLHQRKKSIHGGHLAIDLGKKIKEMMEVVDKKILEHQEESGDDILAQVQKNAEELELYIGAISYGSDVSQIFNLDIREKTMNLLEYLNEEEKKKWKKKLLALVSKRSSEIAKEEKKEAEKKEMEIARKKNEINEEIDILIEMLETVHTIETVNEIKATDTLAKKIESEIADLPTSVSGELEIKYNKAFKNRIFHIRRENIKEKGIVQNLDDSGIDTMLYYVDTEKKDVPWSLVGDPTSQGLIKLGISLDEGKRIYSGDDFFENSDKFADVLIGKDIKFEVTQSEYIKLTTQLEEWKSYGKAELSRLLERFSNIGWKNREAPFKNLRLRSTVEVPQENKKIEARDLFNGLPANVSVEYKNGKGVDKEKDGEEQEITIKIQAGERSEEITVVVTLDVKNNKIRVIEKEQNEILKEIIKLKSRFREARYVEKLANRLIKKTGLNPRSVKEVDHNYIVLDEEIESLKALSGSLLNQKKRSGIVILEGGPGLGKTVMCEYLSAVTNREMVRVQCSKKISYSEFFFAPTLRKGDTSRNPAEWIKMMQKPGTIILFDEIDKLNAECMAGLHALFDSGRHIHDPQLGDFYADPDCLFLGTMNSYDPLPKAIASRATIQKIDYPSEVNEAYKISKYVDNEFLEGLSYEEFKEIWAGQNENKGEIKNSKEHHINEILHNIRNLLKAFALLRKKYNEDEYDRFEYELSYRDAAQIFSAYRITHNFKKAVSDILTSKASSVVGVREQEEQIGMVEAAIGQVFG